MSLLWISPFLVFSSPPPILTLKSTVSFGKMKHNALFYIVAFFVRAGGHSLSFQPFGLGHLVYYITTSKKIVNNTVLTWFFFLFFIFYCFFKVSTDNYWPYCSENLMLSQTYLIITFLSSIIHVVFVNPLLIHSDFNRMSQNPKFVYISQVFFLQVNLNLFIYYMPDSQLCSWYMLQT